MSEKKKIFHEPDDNSIRWFGIDGLLLIMIVAEIIIGIIGLKYRIDFLSGYLFPITLLAIVLVVTINYAMTLGGFIRMQNDQIAEHAEQKKESAEAAETK